MRYPRSSGILLHITSLPGQLSSEQPYRADSGIGDLGSAAFEFVDFLKTAGQTIWQILPLCPTNEGDSPYSCYSAFAGNPLLVSLDVLVSDGWLDMAGVPAPADFSLSPSQVDFESVANFKNEALRRAYEQSRERLQADPAFDAFCQEKAWWLKDFARFEALMHHFDQADWTQWPAALVQREAAALAQWDQQLADEIEFSRFVQFVFDRQWNALKTYANTNGIRMYGDMPIFVAHESADVWANQSLYALDDRGRPTLVAGVPPDYFSETGQLWGNPLYRWDIMEQNKFQWWTGRFRRALEQFDLLRVDHFRGFESYWEIPADAETAIGGRWQPGPQHKPFDAAALALGELPIIVEDLGMITQGVHDLRERLGFPPMRVMQFGYANADDDFHRPTNYPEHSVAYTGTHDNETSQEWFLNRKAEQARSNEPCDLLERNLDPEQDVHWQLIELVLGSAADTAIIPLQDVLGLGSEARMNIPGEPTGNWRWRVESNQLTDDIAARLLEITQASNR